MNFTVSSNLEPDYGKYFIVQLFENSDFDLIGKEIIFTPSSNVKYGYTTSINNRTEYPIPIESSWTVIELTDDSFGDIIPRNKNKGGYCGTCYNHRRSNFIDKVKKINIRNRNNSSFNFYGEEFTNIYLSSNGNITLSELTQNINLVRGGQKIEFLVFFKI